MTKNQVMQRRTHRALASIQRKLERLELDHLRQLVLAQHNEIEFLQAQIEEAWSAAYNSDRIADMWKSVADEAQDRLEEQGGKLTIGIDQEGCIGVVHAH